MFLAAPINADSQSRIDEPASLELLEYLGSLVESNDELLGPDSFIEKGITDSNLSSKDTSSQKNTPRKKDTPDFEQREVSNEND